LRGNLAAAADRGPTDFPELHLIPGVGPRTVQALAMVAEVVHGCAVPLRRPGAILRRPRRQGPVSVSGAAPRVRSNHSGLKSAVQKARLGRAEELGALTRLDDQARQLERHATGPTVQELIAQERQRSPSYGGRSVFGCEHGRTSEKIGDIGGR